MSTRVVLIRDIERYPHFIAVKGRTGVIVVADPDCIAVRLDDPLDGAEEWDNEVHFYSFDAEDGDVVTEAAACLRVLS